MTDLSGYLFITRFNRSTNDVEVSLEQASAPASVLDVIGADLSLLTLQCVVTELKALKEKELVRLGLAKSHKCTCSMEQLGQTGCQCGGI